MSVTDRDPHRPPKDAFEFGQNWQRYLDRHLDSDREQIAADSLRDLVGELRGKIFLDIGCGSGLFSLCAYRAGAEEVVSLDVDPESLVATRRLHARAGAPVGWRVLHGSILDQSSVATLPRADVVYSWGVLHHTGDMYTAIANAAGCTAPGGLLAIAIYNRITGRWLNSERWWRVKRTYNRVPAGGQKAMELAYGLYWMASVLRARQNPLRIAREYRKARGMAFWTDQRDWLGGYPYESASPAEIIEFCETKCGMRCVKVLALDERESGNNQFVFQRGADPAAADGSDADAG